MGNRQIAHLLDFEPFWNFPNYLNWGFLAIFADLRIANLQIFVIVNNFRLPHGLPQGQFKWPKLCNLGYSCGCGKLPNDFFLIWGNFWLPQGLGKWPKLLLLGHVCGFVQSPDGQFRLPQGRPKLPKLRLFGLLCRLGKSPNGQFFMI